MRLKNQNGSVLVLCSIAVLAVILCPVHSNDEVSMPDDEEGFCEQQDANGNCVQGKGTKPAFLKDEHHEHGHDNKDGTIDEEGLHVLLEMQQLKLTELEFQLIFLFLDTDDDDLIPISNEEEPWLKKLHRIVHLFADGDKDDNEFIDRQEMRALLKRHRKKEFVGDTDWDSINMRKDDKVSIIEFIAVFQKLDPKIEHFHVAFYKSLFPYLTEEDLNNKELPYWVEPFKGLDINANALLEEPEIQDGSERVDRLAADMDLKNMYFLQGKTFPEPFEIHEFLEFNHKGCKILEQKPYIRHTTKLMTNDMFSAFDMDKIDQSHFDTFAKYDTNKDGTLSLVEQQTMQKDLMKDTDIDEDILEKADEFLEFISSQPDMYTGLYYKDIPSVFKWENGRVSLLSKMYYKTLFEDLQKHDKFNDGYMPMIELNTFFKSRDLCELGQTIYRIIRLSNPGEYNLTACEDSKQKKLLSFEGVSGRWYNKPKPVKMLGDVELSYRFLDGNSDGLITHDEFVAYLDVIRPKKTNSNGETATSFFPYLDVNNDGMVSFYEMRFGLDDLFEDSKTKEKFEENKPMIRFLKSLIDDWKIHNDKTLLKTFQLFDEDLNAKMNGRELRAAVVMMKRFAIQRWVDHILARVDENNDKKLTHDEFKKLQKLTFYDIPETLCSYQLSTCGHGQEWIANLIYWGFQQLDTNSNGYIDKKELTNSLQPTWEIPLETDDDTRKMLQPLCMDKSMRPDWAHGRNLFCPFRREPEEEIDATCRLIWEELMDDLALIRTPSDKTTVTDLFHFLDKDKNEAISVFEFEPLFKRFHLEDAKSDFYKWMTTYLGGSKDVPNAAQMKKELKMYDTDGDLIVTKGEMITFLNKKRPDFYTNERANFRYTRSDRDGNGIITLAEYELMALIKMKD